VLLIASCQFDTTGIRGLDDDASPESPDASTVGVDGAVDYDAPPVDPPDGGVPDAPPLPPDAPPLPPDAAPGQDAPCPTQCSSCEPDGTCVINCGAGECNSGVTCPPDRPCEVNCIGDGACETGFVDCGEATRCDINCIGHDACDNAIFCAGSTCTVVCDGHAACEDVLVECDADSCDITCTGTNACAAGVCCDDETCSNCTATSGGSCDCPSS
jgi:hypothetical protein